jgi:hypothetical protein
MSAQSLLNKLVKEKSPPKAKAKTPERPIKVMGEGLAQWVAAAVAFDVMESRKDVEAGSLNEQLVGEFAEQLYNQGFQPVNPKVVTIKEAQIDHQANWTIQSKFKLAAKTSAELKDDLIVALDDERGTKLFENEIDTTPLTTLRPFNELVIGHYQGKDFVSATEAEKAVATKLLTFVQGEAAEPLTDEERDLVLVHQDQMKVKPGFFDRVKGYCESVDDLKRVFKVIVPVYFLSHAKFALSDTPQERHNRLTEAVGSILGEVEE